MMIFTSAALALTPSYDPLFVLLSYLIAIGASYSALEMTARVTLAKGRARLAWLMGGAATMGGGIWSMHFTGMLAFKLPIPTSGTYDVGLTALSLVIAIVVSGIALSIASRESLGGPRLVGGGSCLGVGIASMHYVGMAAMRGPCVMGYSPVPFALSIMIAVGASIVALWLAFQLKNESLTEWSWSKFGSALLMGGAIAGMHYTGMYAGRFLPVCGASVHTDGLVGVSSLGGAAIAFSTLLIIAVAMIGSYRERLRWQQELLKDRFLSILSHELRTPLNAILGYGSILEDELMGTLTAEQHHGVRMMLEGGESMLRLVDDLLDMSRIQAGKFTLCPSHVDFHDIADTVIARLVPLARHKHQQLLDHVPAGLPTVSADPQRVHQILVNLIGNAIKFTPEGGSITLRTALQADYLRCEVVDTGIGIGRRERRQLFQPFSRVDTSATRQRGGTGLGLAISKALVEANGGQIGLESEPGEGTTFWFTLPLKPALGTHAQAPSPG